MNHEVLKTVIFDQQEVIKNEVIYQRDYVLQDDVNYILVGLRRAGKSTLLHKRVLDLISKGVKWNQIIYINFEDERLIEFTYNDFNDILLVKNELTDNKAYFFFDEIQNIDGWEKFVRRLADSNERVCITGSNSKMLSNEMSASLGGRYITKYVMPYDLKEYLRVREIKDDVSTSSKGNILRCVNEYLKFGGLPSSIDLIDKKEYISSVFQKLFYNDILVHNNVRGENSIKVLIKKLAETTKDEISFTKLYNIMKSIGFSISKDTVIDYVNYIINSNLIFQVKNYYASFVDKESTPKYYFTDNGILNLFLIDKDSRLLENGVAIALKRLGEDFYYLKSLKTGIDIDFYVPNKELAIQVAYSLNDINVESREVSSLLKFSKTNENARLIIVTLSESKILNVKSKDIEVVSFYDLVFKVLKNE